MSFSNMESHGLSRREGSRMANIHMETASRELREETGYNRPMPKEGEKIPKGGKEAGVIGFPMDLGQPYSIDITRPAFTGNGWAGEPKCIRYYLGTVNSTS